MHHPPLQRRRRSPCCIPFPFPFLLVLVLVLPWTSTLVAGAGAQQWVVQDEYEVDVHRFAHLVSTHLLFDHLDTTFMKFSRQIAHRFRNGVRINTDNGTRCSPLDVQVLNGQVSGAVGSYIEDTLSSVWNQHATALDKMSLEFLIEHAAHDLCPSSSTTAILNRCLAEHAPQLLASLNRHVAAQLRTTIGHIMQHDVPLLLTTTQRQVASLLAHFDQPGCHLSVSALQLQHDDTAAWNNFAADVIHNDLRGLLHNVGRVEDSVYQFAMQASS